VLMLSSRGVSFQLRHLMNDLRSVMPHAKSDTKLERKERYSSLVESCEMRNSQLCMFFEMRKRKDSYMWISRMPDGPSAKFLIENIHTMGELRLTGNSLRYSRPILAFAPEFDSQPHWRLLKELFGQTFNTPKDHPKSQPFVDRVVSFSIADERIWYRSYSIVDEEDANLSEIGPRFTAQPIAIFAGAFGGAVLWHNPSFQSPNVMRSLLRRARSARGIERRENKLATKAKGFELDDEEGNEEDGDLSMVPKKTVSYKLDPTDVLFADAADV